MAQKYLDSHCVDVVASPVASDHLCINFCLGAMPSTVSSATSRLNFDRADYEVINASLIATDWNVMFADSCDVDDMYRRLMGYLRTLVELHVPCSRDQRDTPISSCVARIQRQIVNCDTSDVRGMQRLQKDLKKCLARQRVLLEKQIAASSSSSRFYGYVSSMLRTRDDLSVLIDGHGSRVTDNAAKANLLCDVFEENYVVPPDAASSSSGAVLCPSDVQTLNDIDFSELAVYNCLKDLPAKRSLNPELLPAVFFKRAALGLALPLSLLFQLSFESGAIPSIFREAWVAPVHKKGSRTDPRNKRPVSLTSVICKTMERLVCTSLLANAERHGLLMDRQFAYRKKRSTADCLLTFMNFLAMNVNRRVPVDIVFTDFKSAFERMPHDLLISVLPQKGVGPKIVRWISEFLSARSFKVKVGDSFSRTGLASTGCPQGTVLGSLLFLFFIDQLKHVLGNDVEFFVFADDVKLAMPLRDPLDCCRLQRVLDDLYTFTQKMSLQLSTGKCGVLRVGSMVPAVTYKIGEDVLCRLDTVRDLGVLFSPTLSFSEHVNTTVKKCSLIGAWILRAFAVKDPSVYLNLYRTYVVPHLEYCSIIWCPRFVKDRALLERMQNRFLRRVEIKCNLPRKTLELLTVSERMEQADVSYLRRLIRNESRFDELLDLALSNSRRGFVLRARELPKSARIAHIYPWRISSHMNR